MNAPRAGLNEASTSSQVVQREAVADNAGDGPLVALHSRAGVALIAATVLASTVGFLDPVFAHGISLREPAWPADVDAEEVE
jgi:hypothetical protein